MFVFLFIIQVLGITFPWSENILLQRTLNSLGLAILNLRVVQDVRKTRISELSVISSEERGFKTSLKTNTISSRLIAYRQHFFKSLRNKVLCSRVYGWVN